MIIAYEGETVLNNEWHPDFKYALEKSGMISLFSPEALAREDSGNGGVMLKDDGMTTGEAVISLTGVVLQKSFLADIFAGDYICAHDVAMCIGQIDKSVARVRVQISSPGGVVSEGSNVYEALKEMGKDKMIITECLAEAASMGSVIFCAGKRREMHKHTSYIMMHEGMSAAAGRADVMISTAEYLEKVNNNMSELYAAAGKETAAKYREKMKKSPGYWFSAAEAIESGLATHIIEEAQPAEGLSRPTDEKSLALWQKIYNDKHRSEKPAAELLSYSDIYMD